MHIRHSLFFFNTSTGLANHLGWKTSMIKPAAKSRATSFPTIFLLSSFNLRKPCLTGFAPGLTCNLCSASSAGTPGMSLGVHAKTSLFSRMNSMSALSYLSVKLDPTANCLEESPGVKSTILVSWAGLNFSFSSAVVLCNTVLSAGST